MLIRRSRLQIATAVLLSACGATSPANDPTATVRDSAGVTIVENPAPSEGPDLGWSLGAAPSLDIGAVDGPEEYQFFRVRDAMRLSGGRLAVVNSGSGEVRVYSADGSFLESWGNQGEGPGEYVQPVAMVAWPPDSLAVWDWRQRRVSVLAPDGTYRRSFTVPIPEGMAFPEFSHVLEGGRVVVSAQGFPPGPPQSGRQRNLMSVAILSPEGEMISDLGEYRGDEVYTQVGDGNVEVMLLPFSRRSVVAPAAGAEILVSGTGRFEIRYFSEDGLLKRIARVGQLPHLVTDSDREMQLARSLADAPVERHPGIRRTFETVPMPDTLPAFSRVVLDATGHQWIRIYRAPTDTGPDRWIVLDAQGVLRGAVDVPEGFDIYEIGTDYVLGRATDELDVEHVQMWPLLRHTVGNE